jgi:peptidoglycan/LPS O-acetylase OafA/YrhL
LFDYVKRRVLRIYPAFILNFWLCLLIVAPLVGAGLSPFHPHALIRNAARTVLLFHPNAQGIFPGMPYGALNGSMWTIPYEFHCYILVMIVGAAGLLKGPLRYVLLVAVLVGLAFAGFAEDRPSHGVAAALLGTLDRNLQLVPMFGAGAIYALFQRNVSYSHVVAAIAAAALSICLFFSPVVPFALAVFGGYLIFWFAFHCPVFAISRFANKTDLSYGIYLYAWPIQSMIAFFTHRAINPWVLSAISLALAAAAAWVSWTFLEKPALALAHRQAAGSRQPQLSPDRPHQSAT